VDDTSPFDDDDDPGAPAYSAPLVESSFDDTAPPGDEEHHVPVFTVTNPPGTVTVSAYMDGRVQDVELSARAATLTESSLAEEIVVVAGLATQSARAAQYAFMLDGMKQHGHDSVATRDFLERDLQLPSPEQATAAKAAVFADRYTGEE
jgi:hypothetical protein